MRVTYTDVTEYETHKFVTEASDLGIAPGAAYPHRINTDMGNGMDFILDGRVLETSTLYRQMLGCISLTVLND